MSSDPNGRDTIVRYTAGVRTNHWIVAISFVLAALSGLALFHPAMFWLSELFGGGPWTRILHPYIALVMVVAFLFLATLLLLVLFESGYALWQMSTKSDAVLFWTRPDGSTRRGGGTFINPNIFAGFLELAFGLVLVLLIAFNMN